MQVLYIILKIQSRVNDLRLHIKATLVIWNVYKQQKLFYFLQKTVYIKHYSHPRKRRAITNQLDIQNGIYNLLLLFYCRTDYCSKRPILEHQEILIFFLSFKSNYIRIRTFKIKLLFCVKSKIYYNTINASVIKNAG